MKTTAPKKSKLVGNFNPQHTKAQAKIDFLRDYLQISPQSAQDAEFRRRFEILNATGIALDTVKTRVAALEDYLTKSKFQYTKPEVQKIIYKRLQLLQHPLPSLQARIKDNCQFLQDKKIIAVDKLGAWTKKTFAASPRLFCSANNYFETCYQKWEKLLCTNYGFQPDQARAAFQQFILHPTIIALSAETIKARIDDLQQQLQWSNAMLQKILMTTPIALGQTYTNITTKYKIFQDSTYQFTTAEINQLVTYLPAVITYSEAQLAGKLQQIAALNISKDELLKSPRLLAVPLGSLQLRYAILRQAAPREKILALPGALIVNEQKTYARLRYLQNNHRELSFYALSSCESHFQKWYHVGTDVLMQEYPLTPEIKNALLPGETLQSFAK